MAFDGKDFPKKNSQLGPALRELPEKPESFVMERGDVRQAGSGGAGGVAPEFVWVD